ncbi:ferritin family protein [Telmatospirillum sp.]|uniref:ferritin-like domain-containing protein n=1 Tax=Telmatospirillum sp. TaxID=2079197 RepID=UPI00283F67EA|nr:ferritin family protein [Telmatospirillum sp.]MDR3436249.1 ferritin family protein [Telmatospirillum sp.]
MSEVEQFLEAAVKLERDSASRYDELADAINGQGQADVVAFFRKQALYSRRHLQQAEARIGKREPWDGVEPEKDGDPKTVAFPGGESPEAAAIWAADGMLSVDDAMALALEAEEKGRVYYATVAGATRDPEVRTLAEAFAKEEGEHVQALKELIARFAKA